MFTPLSLDSSPIEMFSPPEDVMARMKLSLIL
jgi:hypothetical protein